jgi:tRNA pseudouridine13 synthase
MEQRFGREGDNIATFLHKSPQDRGSNPVDSILLSSLRSFLFNEVLAQRVTDGSWNLAQAGDVIMLNGTHSIFVADANDEALPGRLASGDVHVTGPMWGQGELPSRGVTAQREHAVADRYPDLTVELEKARLQQDRRSFRQIPADFAYKMENDVLVLSFTLPAGAYATALLRELVNYNA